MSKQMATRAVTHRMTTDKLGEAMILAIEIIQNRSDNEISPVEHQVGELLHHTAVAKDNELYSDEDKIRLANWVLDQHVDWSAVGSEVVAFLDQVVIADRMKDKNKDE